MSNLIDRDSVLALAKDICVPIKDGEYRHRCIDPQDVMELSSVQPDIKKAAKLLSDFIESCPGGDSYLITPDGEELRTDWGYAMEGIQLIYDWAERREE